MRIGTHGLGLIVSMTLGGCLAEQGRVGDTATGTTTNTTTSPDTTDSETTVGDTTSTDTTDVECGSCDDDDPCTVDECVAGECQHYGVPGTPDGDDPQGVALPTCDSDDDCNWGGPCEVGTCIIQDGCGTAGVGYCSFETTPGCGNCDLGCDDGNACTIDYCSNGTCEHFTESDCNPGCTKDGLVPLVEVVNAFGTPEVKTVGEVTAFRNTLTCNDGPLCGCVSKAALEADSYQLALDDGGQAEGAEVADPPTGWQCTTEGCVTAVTECQPMPAGVTFRMWGTGVHRGYVIPFGAEADAFPAPPPPVDTLIVADYCLDTEPSSLEGTYAGRMLTSGQWIDFVATMNAVDQGVILAMKAPVCASTCPEWVQQAFPISTVLEEGDGRIGFDFEAPYPSGSVPARADLFSGREAFAGRWLIPDDTGEAIPVGGRVILKRLGDNGFSTTP